MAEVISEQFKKLRAKLHEMFQLDRSDLDFGIYRIMNLKRAEIVNFLDDGLLPQVKAALSEYDSGDKDSLKRELIELENSIVAAGMDPEDSPKVRELRAKLANSTDVTAIENEVYSHLYNFFRRYYSEGDFISQRRYKEGVYAIPYEGEEVKLYWANHDQYYIKTAEYFRDYSFRLPGGKRVTFQLTDVTTEQNNVKSDKGKERRFALADPEPVSVAHDNATIRFTYLPSTSKQKDLNAEAIEKLKVESILTSEFHELWATAGTEANPERTLLEKHLTEYTARNTFDYFIHKNLKKFLCHELDFFIKNEVLHLDDLDKDSVGTDHLRQRLAKIKALRKIAHKIIDFVYQLEEFQKKIWLKKKFVIETNYCITLDLVPPELYPEIAANDLQREEWVKVFAIDEIMASQGDLASSGSPAYSVPLTKEFLQSNQHLILDTQFFPEFTKAKLLSSINNLDTSTSGILIHSENFQALNLALSRFYGMSRCIYIDPPYNTDASAIPYKNDYKHSSWATMIRDRLALLKRLMQEDGAIFVSIDKEERAILEQALIEVFGHRNKVEELIWSMNTNNSQAPNYSTNHEYVEVFAKNKAAVESDPLMFREPKPGYSEVMALVSQLNPLYPPLNEVEEAIKSLYGHRLIHLRDEVEEEGLNWEEEKRNDPWRGLYSYTKAEYRNADGELLRQEEARSKNGIIWIWQEGDASMPATKQASSTKDPNDVNYRFYKPEHPVTRKPCPHPKSGWKFRYEHDEDSTRRSFVSLNKDNRIAWGDDEKKVPRLKRFLHEVETNVGKSVFTDYSDGEKQTSAMFGESGLFLAPKHASFVSRFIQQAASKDSLIVDCFGGSGSTAHAVIATNREDRGTRKFLLAEMGHYFDTLLKPRVLKAAYAPDWRNGKPTAFNQGTTQLIKYVRLESYEDALANLHFRQDSSGESFLDAVEGTEPDTIGEQYVLQYMLKAETVGSPSLLNVTRFSDPENYTLAVKNPSSDETRTVNVDLMETFNWLLGIRVEHIDLPQTFSADFERSDDGRLALKGDRIKPDDAGAYWFRTITGWIPESPTQPQDSNRNKVLVLWRKLTGSPEQDNLVLDHYFRRQRYSTKDLEFDLIYVNGDNNLENIKRSDEKWKVRLIEEDFHQLMFETKDI